MSGINISGKSYPSALSGSEIKNEIGSSSQIAPQQNDWADLSKGRNLKAENYRQVLDPDGPGPAKMIRLGSGKELTPDTAQKQTKVIIIGKPEPIETGAGGSVPQKLKLYSMD